MRSSSGQQDQRQLFRDSSLATISFSGCLTREEFISKYQCSSQGSRQISAKGPNACELILEAQAICSRLHNVKLIDPVYQLPKLHEIEALNKPFEISIVLEPIIQLVGNKSPPVSDVNKWDLIVAHSAAYVMHGISIIGFNSVSYHGGMLAFYPGVGMHSLLSDSSKTISNSSVLNSRYFS